MAAATAHRSYLQAGPWYFGLFAVLLLGFAAFIKFRGAGIMISCIYFFRDIRTVLYGSSIIGSGIRGKSGISYFKCLGGAEE